MGEEIKTVTIQLDEPCPRLCGRCCECERIQQMRCVAQRRGFVQFWCKPAGVIARIVASKEQPT